MEKENEQEKKKGFFTKLFENLDKKLEAKEKKSGCGCKPKDSGSSCCS